MNFIKKSVFISLSAAVLFLTLIGLPATHAQTINQSFFTSVDAFFQAEVKNGTLDYAQLKTSKDLDVLIMKVEDADLSGTSDATQKAFYINAYNLHVINQARQGYPLESVQSIGGFFDRKKVRVAGESFTLNNLEKKKLLTPYQDARLHFVLVCGALGCPPITDFAYTPESLDTQLEQQTTLALNDPSFLKNSGNKVELSQIFKWYQNDFGGNKEEVIKFINQYRNTAIPANAKISYYPYDWTLNDQAISTSSVDGTSSSAANAARYVVSSVIPKGTTETKIFNNLYTQQTGNNDALTDRATFLTTSVSFLYGISNKWNIGFNTRYRRVRNDVADSSPLSVISGGDSRSSRQGLTAFGPQIRYAPVESWTNFSIQSSFVFPIGSDLAGSSTQPYIDWTGPTWNTQFFNDFSIGQNFSLFTELDLLIEDIGSQGAGHLNRLSTPATLIFSYLPNPKTTLYTLGGFSPYWQSDFDYFYQYGLGAKYQFTPSLELELLVTDFTNKFLANTGGQASTFNVGFRFNI